MSRTNMIRIASTTFKALLGSLVVGMALSQVGITAESVLSDMGLEPATIINAVESAFGWAIPKLVLGSMVILPVWFATYLFRPPRG